MDGTRWGRLDTKWTERAGEGWTQNGRNELGKVGHKMDGTSAVRYVRLDVEVDAGGRRPSQSSAAILGSYFQGWNRGRLVQWLRCCATNRKVTGSIPAGVSGFFIDIKWFRSHYGPGVDSASNRNEYQEYFLGVKAAGA